MQLLPSQLTVARCLGPPSWSARRSPPPPQPAGAGTCLQHSRWICQKRGSGSRGRVRRNSGGGGGGDSLDSALYDPDVPLKKLQQMLEQAVDDEEYEAAAQLRDVIQQRGFDNRLAVEEANRRFYAAFQSGSVAAMSEVWGKGEHVQCIHPLAGCIAGRQAVMESWRLLLGSGRLRIALEDVRIAASDTHAFLTCLEITESGEGKGRIAATNIFEKQGGSSAWKLVHHHASPSPPPGSMF